MRAKPFIMPPNSIFFCLFAALTLSGANSFAAELGYPAPDFQLPGSDGQTHRLADYRGRHVVLSFFPRAFVGR